MSLPSAPIRILGVAAICVLALVGLVVAEARARAGGTEVIMAMQPVDPRSLLSGHYVIVSLQEALPPGAPCPDALANGGAFGPWNRDAALASWVALAPNGSHHSAVGVFATREAAARGGAVAARGGAGCTPAPTDIAPGAPAPRANTFTYLGVDRFHIDQARAERIERVLRDRMGQDQADVFAILSIGQDGRARMKGLIVEGERLELSLF